jgi:NAD(P)-dependent dehydrogenase (short-subunit alcohol dehydrogenase family)
VTGDEQLEAAGEGFDPRRLFDLTGSGVLVIGAGQGLGAATSRVLSAYGARVLCVDLDKGLAEAIAAEVGGVPWSGDVTDEAQALELVETATNELGGIDGMVDVVGGALFKPLAELTLEDWDGQFQRNLRHAFVLGREVGARQAASGGGSIVFISSIAAFYGGRLHAAYGASKAALLAWTKALAQEYGPAGVRVNAIAPGATSTPRNRRRWSEDPSVERETADATLLKRVGQDWHIGAAALYLTAPAGGNVTGQCLTVDGGTLALEPFLARGEGYERIAADSELGGADLSFRKAD